MDLSVDVGDADLVEVDQRDASDTGSGERLGRPRAHAPDPDDHHMGAEETGETGAAIQSGDTAEAFRDIVHVFRGSNAGTAAGNSDEQWKLRTSVNRGRSAGSPS
jgi:hypothetical protein